MAEPDYEPVEVDRNVPERPPRGKAGFLSLLILIVALAVALLWNGSGIRTNRQGRATVIVSVDYSKIVNIAGTKGKNGHGYGCVSIDFWPATKCDYGRCSWVGASSLTLPLAESDGNGHFPPPTLPEVRLRKALTALSAQPASPVVLRLGGSTGDLVRYNTSADVNCTEFSAFTDKLCLGYDVTSGCMSLPRWDALNRLCSCGTSDEEDSCEGGVSDRCRFVFGVNGLYGRTKLACTPNTTCWVSKIDHDDMPACCTAWEGEWDSSNTEALLRYTRSKGYRVWGFEYGNEMAGFGGVQIRLEVKEYVKGFCEMARLVNEIWSDVDVKSRPKVLAPDSAFDQIWFHDFLVQSRAKGCPPDIVTWHQYLLGAGKDPKVGGRAMNPNVLNAQKTAGDSSNRVVHPSGGWFNPELWMGETGGAYNSGRHSVTDAFHGSFWYLDSMGILAARGHQAFCRQTLIGGNYGLLNTTTFEPNPDYYALLLFQRLMGDGVLRTSVVGGDGLLRAYAHCARGTNVQGSITLLVINLSNETVFDVEMSATPSGTLSDLNRMEWVMSSESLQSQKVSLNGGAFLTSSETGDIPVLPGANVAAGASGLSMHPHTYAFVRMDGAGVKLCSEFG